MFRSKRPLKDRVEALKTRKDKRYYELGLRDDLAQLIAVGLSRNPGVTQRELTGLAGWKSESYVSRLANAATNFKIGAVVRVLVPLGIIPMLVEKAEWDRLLKLEESQTNRASQPIPGRSVNALSIQSEPRQLGTIEPGILGRFYGFRITERSTVGGTSETSDPEIASAGGVDDNVDRSRVLLTQT